jgi:hypothetical protein
MWGIEFLAGDASIKTTLIAPCGMNCAVCLGFLRKEKRCAGCFSIERVQKKMLN